MIRTIAAHAALTREGVMRNPLIRIDGRRIVSLSQYDPQQLDTMHGTEFYAGMLVPQLVDAHLHLELSYLRGAIPRGSGFAGFAAAMARTRHTFTPGQRHEAASAADAELRREGTGIAGDIANDDTAFAVKERSTMLYRTFAEVFGLNTPSFAAAEELLSHTHTTLTPHSTYSLQDEPFRRLCREGVGPLSIHFMETLAERELYEGRGALHEWYRTQGWRCDFLHYGSPAERITACVPHTRSVMLVHCCCVTQRDIDLIMNHFSAPVYWVLCPRSNEYISGLRPDVQLLRSNGLNICAGTDSLASNDRLSIVEELKALGDVPADEALRWATATGAAALGFGEAAATLAEGNECGLTLIEGLDLAANRLTPAARSRAIA